MCEFAKLGYSANYMLTKKKKTSSKEHYFMATKQCKGRKWTALLKWDTAELKASIVGSQ